MLLVVLSINFLLRISIRNNFSKWVLNQVNQSQASNEVFFINGDMFTQYKRFNVIDSRTNIKKIKLIISLLSLFCLYLL